MKDRQQEDLLRKQLEIDCKSVLRILWVAISAMICFACRSDVGPKKIIVSDMAGQIVCVIEDPSVINKFIKVLELKKLEEVKFKGRWNIQVDAMSIMASHEYVKIDGVSYRIAQSVEDVLQLKNEPTN